MDSNAINDKIATAHLLEFIAKAQKISSSVNVEKVDGGYGITIYCDWDNDDNFWSQSAFISDKGKSAEFYEFSATIDTLVKIEEEREIKLMNLWERRQEVLSRLSDEEKELLGVR